MYDTSELTSKQRDIIHDYLALPLKTFADDEVLRAIIHAMKYGHQMRHAQWQQSPEYAEHLAKEAASNARRRERELERASEREDWAKTNIRNGMIIKVRGARDGHGMREVISIESSHLVCRQLYKLYTQKVMDAPIRVFGKKENEIIGFNYADQITTHGYDKVIAYGALARHSNGSAGYTMKKVP